MKCDSYCEHGGICVLERGHNGMHDSRYCQWDDEHALTEQKADEVLAGRGGEGYLRLKAVVQPLFGDEKL